VEKLEEELASYKSDPNCKARVAETSTKLYEKDQELKKVRSMAILMRMISVH
jgi:hypothetical protein